MLGKNAFQKGTFEKETVIWLLNGGGFSHLLDWKAEPINTFIVIWWRFNAEWIKEKSHKRHTWLYQKRKTDNIFWGNRLWNAAKMWTVGTRNLELFFTFGSHKNCMNINICCWLVSMTAHFFCALNCSEMWMIQTLLWNKQTSDFLITSVSIKYLKILNRLHTWKANITSIKLLLAAAHICQERGRVQAVFQKALWIHTKLFEVDQSGYSMYFIRSIPYFGKSLSYIYKV